MRTTFSQCRSRAADALGVEPLEKVDQKRA